MRSVNPFPLPGHPVARDDAFPQTLGGPTAVPPPGLLGNDSVPCGPEVKIKLVNPPQFGTVTINRNGGLVYTPGAQQRDDSLVYEINCNGLVGADSSLHSSLQVAAHVSAASG